MTQFESKLDKSNVDLDIYFQKQSEILASIQRQGLLSDNLSEVTYADGDILFREGDEGNDLYIIQDGVAAIYRSESNEPKKLLARLKRGEAFGERALLGNGKRTATVIAEGVLTVLVLDRKNFFRIYENEPKVKSYFETLQKIYPLSATGVATQYSGEFLGRPAVSVLIRKPGGSAAIATHLMDAPIFTIRSELYDASKIRSVSYVREDQGIERRLDIVDGNLVGAYVSGEWGDRSVLLQLVINRIPWTSDLDSWIVTGGALPDKLALLVRGQVCRCMQVTENELRAAIQRGANSLSSLQDATGAGAFCGGCIPDLQKLLGIESRYYEAELSEIIEYSANVRSFRFVPIGSEFEASQLGDHIIVAGILDGVQVHRQYTLTSPAGETAYREITVRRDDLGVFSNFLFNLVPGARIKLSSAKRGIEFTGKETNRLVCFSAGIGITPALALTRSLATKQDKRPVDIIHCASNSAGLSGQFEFEAIARNTKWLTYNAHVSSDRGRITAHDVEMYTNDPKAQYLICGPIGFQKFVADVLQKRDVLPHRILIETFGKTGQTGQEISNESARAGWLGAILALAFIAYATITPTGVGKTKFPEDVFAWMHSSYTGSLITGMILLILLMFQSRLSILRTVGRWKSATDHKSIHQWVGAMTPLFLAFHTVRFGYGVSLILTVCLLLLSIGSFVLQPAYVGTKIRRVFFIAHVALGVSLIGLLLAHIWIVVRY